MTISHLLVFVSRNLNEGNKIHLIRFQYYPGCQRLFMRGFRFRSVLKSEVREKRKAKSFFSRLRRSCLRPAADETKLPVAREKNPLVPWVFRCVIT